DLFVPASQTMQMFGEPPKRGGALYSLPDPRIFVGNELGPVAVGIATRALEDMLSLSTATARRADGIALSDRPAFHKTVGVADSKLRAAEVLYREAVDLGWRRVLD